MFSLLVMVFGGLMMLFSSPLGNNQEDAQRIRLGGFVLLLIAIALRGFLGW